MIGYIFANFREGKAFLKRLDARKMENEPYPAYKLPGRGGGEEGIALICGMGPERAAGATEYLLSKFPVSAVINPGICASTLDGIEIGEIFRISYVREETQETSGNQAEIQLINDDRFFADLPTARLTTVKIPVFEQERKEQIGKWGELIDMEGAAIARICADKRIPCYLVKGVSDHADHQGEQVIQETIDPVSEKLATVLFPICRKHSR